MRQQRENVLRDCRELVTRVKARVLVTIRCRVYSGYMPSYLTARQAAKLLSRTPSIAARRAKEAAKRGDPAVIKVERAWAAPESWWREHVELKPMGRPRLHADNG